MAEFDGSGFSSSEESTGVPPPTKKQKFYKQKYNKKWERDPQLKGWLSSVPKYPYKASCTICGKELVAGLSELKKHLHSKKHQEQAKSVTTTRPITTMIVSDTISEKVKRAEVKMTAFLVKHHLPFQSMDHLSDLVTDIFPDSEIAAKFQSKHTKPRAIVKHILADHF